MSKRCAAALVILAGFLGLVKQANADGVSLCTGYKALALVSAEGPKSYYACFEFDPLDKLAGQLSQISPFTYFPLSIAVGPTPAVGVEGFDLRWDHVEMSLNHARSTDAKALLALFPHEVGHAIFNAYLSDHTQVFSNLQALKQAYRRYLVAILPIFAVTSSEQNCEVPTSPCGQKVAALIKLSPIDLNDQSPEEKLRAFEKNDPAVLRMSVFAPRYHELYADLTNAIYYRDPNINDLGLQSYGFASEPCRTFSAELPANFQTTDPHCALSKIRVKLWNKFIMPRIDDPKELLKVLAAGLGEDLIAQFNDPNRLQPDSDNKVVGRLSVKFGLN